MAEKILIVDDEKALLETLAYNLKHQGYDVETAEDGPSAIETARRIHPDAIILDIMLPGMDGVEALERIRSENLKLPVLILTARSSADDKVEGLKAGADDYLTKPFHLEEFLLRVRRMLDRYQWYKPEDVLQISNTRVDFNTLEIEDNTGKISRITPHEANLIQYITLHQDRIVTRSELLKNVWGLDPDIETRTVDTFISRIRRYLEKDPSKPEHIISIRGKGYRFLP